ncbi:DUF6177 family protein [Streptomyces sp. NPDC041068]|uniref:DUF6177 family protein n=1 Tax=Streptomyces sp. NPDC041068 TaxID=3155130 RepID=UPI003404C23D
MTKDVIALTPKMPDTWALLAGLAAGGPDAELATAAGTDAVIQLRGPGGRPLVSVEAPVLVHVPGEAQRLLGAQVAAPDGPFWWTEARASTAIAEAERLAGSVCGRLTLLLGGTTWPAEAATTEVVPPPADVTALPAPAEAQPAVDVLTDSTAVVLHDRPVLALTTWLSDIFRTTAQSGLSLQIVTPPHVRLSAPARATLARIPNRWVVQDPDHGYYDGLSGAVLSWQNGTFAPNRSADGQTSMAKAFTAIAPPADRQLIVALRTVHRADERLILGRALETAWTHLTGAPPAGWGTAEPVNLPWSTRQLTDLARDRAPAPTHLLAVGHPDRPAIGNHRITRTAGGVEEDITLTLGYGPGETPPLDAITTLAETLTAEHDLATMLVSLRRARRDLTAPPHFEAPPIPLSFTLGPEDVHDIGLDHARHPPLGPRPVQLGAPTRPALHYALGDGTDPKSWTALQQLTRHLRAAQALP